MVRWAGPIGLAQTWPDLVGLVEHGQDPTPLSRSPPPHARTRHTRTQAPGRSPFPEMAPMPLRPAAGQLRRRRHRRTSCSLSFAVSPQPWRSTRPHARPSANPSRLLFRPLPADSAIAGLGERCRWSRWRRNGRLRLIPFAAIWSGAHAPALAPADSVVPIVAGNH
jgi:hypothetical protein